MTDEARSFPLLDFEYNKRLYEKMLTFEPHPSFMDKVSILTDDYMKENFGLNAGDAQDALGHAAGVLKQLEDADSSYSVKPDRSHPAKRSKFDTPPDVAALTADLEDDFRNYCACVRCGTGQKETLRELMEALLCYEEPDAVYDEVMDWNKTVNSKEASPKKMPHAPCKETIFDFQSLYLKQGDRFLFLNRDVPEAMRFYRLASLKWNIADGTPSDSRYSAEQEELYLLYTALSQGRPSYGRASLRNENFLELYNQIVSREEPLYESPERVELLSSFLDSVQYLLNVPYPDSLHLSRAALLAVISLTQKYLIVELAQLHGKGKTLKKAKEEKVFQKSQLLFGTPFDALARYAVRYDCGEASYDSYLLLAKAAYLSTLLLTELAAKGKVGRIAYYTSSEVFSYMLPEKCTGDKKDRLGKLTVMHLSYMNDPNEGQTLLKAVHGTRYHIPSVNGRKRLNVPYVFVKCFSPRIDYLPMWEMYGDHAQGCCLVIDWSTASFQQQSLNPTLYRVCYLRKTEKGYTVKTEDNPALADSCRNIASQFRQLQRIAALLDDSTRSYFDTLLGKVIYLFKDSSYSYEQELRVIYQTTENILHTDGGKPWLFVQTPFPLWFEEVILGPKFPNVSTRVPYLQEQIDLMCEKTGAERPSITLSEIDYR